MGVLTPLQPLRLRLVVGVGWLRERILAWLEPDLCLEDWIGQLVV